MVFTDASIINIGFSGDIKCDFIPIFDQRFRTFMLKFINKYKLSDYVAVTFNKFPVDGYFSLYFSGKGVDINHVQTENRSLYDEVKDNLLLDSSNCDIVLFFDQYEEKGDAEFRITLGKDISNIIGDYDLNSIF